MSSGQGGADIGASGGILRGPLTALDVSGTSASSL